MLVSSASDLSLHPLLLSNDDDPIVIGLVNNMPDAALRTTERQYRELLSTAAGGLKILLRLFSLPGLRRGAAGRSHVDRHYEDIAQLWSSHVDGLIVTGTEPKASALVDEPYWPSLTKLIDWAEDHTTSTVWSCLAAHAAVFHTDGVGRRALADKLFGVFDCRKKIDHTLVIDTPSRWRIPHSRHNEVSEKALISRGYDILSYSQEAGVDMFTKQGRSLFVFFQGHPEYDAGALAREYHRDVERFLAGYKDIYPAAPQNYFDEPTTQLLAPRGLGGDQHVNFPTISAAAELANASIRPGVRIYANWLSYLLGKKSRRVVRQHAPIPALKCMGSQIDGVGNSR
jgi:homoserine O-succinyltransferase/O-acetyltransferase